MKFIVDYNDYCGFKQVIYRKDEHSLDTIPWLHEIDFDIALNTLTLTVIDSKMVQLNGFCGLANAQRLKCTPPANQKGVIKVVDSESYAWDAVCVSICNEDVPTYINSKTGWICLGNPYKEGIAVEFIDNCIFVVDENQEFVSLWVHPTYI